MLQDSLKNCEPLTAELDRGMQVIPPGTQESAGFGSLPADFFTLSADEVRREQLGKTEQLDRESMLRTKAMREKEAGVGKKKYKFCLIRVRFPDGYHLQGTFSVHEPFSAVAEFVTENLDTPLPFNLMDSVTGSKVTDQQTTLQEMRLIPAALLNFAWTAEIEADLGGSACIPYLRPDLKQSGPP